MFAYNGYVYIWIPDLGYLSLVSPGSVMLESYLAELHIPLKTISITKHPQDNEGAWNWAELRLKDQLFGVIVSPQQSGPFYSDRKSFMLAEFAKVVGYTKPIRIAA